MRTSKERSGGWHWCGTLVNLNMPWKSHGTNLRCKPTLPVLLFFAFVLVISVLQTNMSWPILDLYNYHATNRPRLPKYYPNCISWLARHSNFTS